MSPSPIRSILSAALFFAGCGQTPAVRTAPRPRPRLVVSVVLDQLGTWVLDRYLPHLSPDGAIRRVAQRGAFHHRVVYPYAGTFTAPGHAAIYTGASPSESGIWANSVWDEARHKVADALDDGRHAVFGVDGDFASPERLRVETVADALSRASGGRSRVVSLSMKHRGAVIPAGRHPHAVFWYDEDVRGFTTSRYYAETLPAWIGEWNGAHPIDRRLTVWEPLDRAVLARSTVPDDNRGEGDWNGLGRTFPHALAAARRPYVALLATPQGSEMLLEFAEEAVRQYELGTDEHPDLLAISISGTDYVGHVFGPESWEAFDNLVRVDLLLARLLERLEQRGSVSVLITADHGVAPLPEQSIASGERSERLDWDVLPAVAERAVDLAVGPGDWIDAYVEPYLYFSARAREPAVRDRVVRAAIDAMRAAPGVGNAFDARSAPEMAASNDPVQRAVAQSVVQGASGDVYVLPARYSVVDKHMPAGTGTSHGTPYEYDTEVPVLFAGPGISHAESTNALEQRRVAATLAAMLGIEPPERARVTPLPGL